MPGERRRSSYNGKDYQVHLTWHPYSDSGDLHHVYWNNHYFTNFEEIIDVNGRAIYDSFTRPRPVSHTKIALSKPLYVGDWQDTVVVNTANYVMPVTPDLVKSWVPSPPSILIGDMALKAWQKFSVQIPEILSIANFIYELKDFRGTLDSIKDFAKMNSLRSSAKKANDTFLEYSFAWAPFVGDLQKMTTVYQKVIDRIDWLRRNRGKTVSLHYNRPDFWKDPLVGSSFLYGQPFVGNQGGENFRIRCTSHDLKFVSTCKLYQDLQGLDDMWAFWKGMAAAVGLNNPAKIVWNAIPFSFVLDWFVPVNSWLSAFSQSNAFSGEWRCFDITTSLKEECRFTFEKEFYPAYGNTNKYLGSIAYQSYVRTVGLPVFLSLADFHALDTHQQALFSSLVLSQIL